MFGLTPEPRPPVYVTPSGEGVGVSEVGGGGGVGGLAFTAKASLSILPTSNIGLLSLG